MVVVAAAAVAAVTAVTAVTNSCTLNGRTRHGAGGPASMVLSSICNQYTHEEVRRSPQRRQTSRSPPRVATTRRLAQHLRRRGAQI